MALGFFCPKDQHGFATQTKIIICLIFIGSTVSTLAVLTAIKYRKHLKIREAMRDQTVAAGVVGFSSPKKYNF
jgi:hypothetical protein